MNRTKRNYPSEPTRRYLKNPSSVGKNKKFDAMSSRNDSTSAVKNIIDLFGGNVVDAVEDKL